MWSLSQQAIVAECSGYIVFFDYKKGKLLNLLEEGGVYADLHAALIRRRDQEDERAAQWATANPKQKKSKM